jgi:hypothetical protein
VVDREFWGGRNPLPLLHEAAQQGLTVTVQTLIDRGVLVNKEYGPKGMPLMYASDCGRFEVAKLLVRNGALLYYTKGNKTFSAIAAAYSYPRLVR